MLIGLLAAAAAAPAPVVVTKPNWVERPTANDFAIAFPSRAQHASISGSAEITCAVGADGRMQQCRVFAEAPVGEGFGAAAVSMAPRMRMAPPGPPPDGVAPIVFIPIHFQMAGAPLPKQTFINGPIWASAPSFNDLATAFPASASSPAGDVSLRCGVAADGALTACEVREERPAGEGFAAAARLIVSKFRVELGGRPARPSDNLAAELKVHLSNPKSAEFQERRIGQPTWVTLPDPAQAAALFPAEAAAKGLKTGRGVASCGVAPDGGLRDCVPLAADPDGLGFSEAAVKIAPLMRMNLWTDAGGPVDGAQVRLPVRFDLPPAKP